MNTHPINSCNHDVPPEGAAKINVQIDGEWMQVSSGLNVIEALKQVGKFIPHYCYHPKLEIAGNCRMCLFEMGAPKLDAHKKMICGKDGKPEMAWNPRPQIACATQVFENMGIRTNSEMVKACQKGVLEFLLVNHPLDCPICDQAGECRLQEFSVEYGQAESRCIEDKVKKPKRVDLGERIVLDDERCILCSRCVRFARDILKDDALGFVKRGSHAYLTVHPCKKFNHPYSLNVTDICPVGALTSKDFRFKMRPWFLKETSSICTSCATGCNITISSRENKIYRLTPRVNENVNSHWMCDHGRLNFHDLDNEKRFRHPAINVGNQFMRRAWPDIFAEIGKQVQNFKGHEIAILASAKMCNEELFLLKQLADDLDIACMDILPNIGEGDSFLKSPDKNPNSKGAEILGVSQGGKKLQSIREGVQKGKIHCLFVFHEDACGIGLEEEDLQKISMLVYVGMLPNRTTHHANFILPASGFAEKCGTMINAKGRLQKLNSAILPPENALNDWEILRDLKYASVRKESEVMDGPCGHASNAILTPLDEIFHKMANQHSEFKGLTLNSINDQGIQLL